MMQIFIFILFKEPTVSGALTMSTRSPTLSEHKVVSTQTPPDSSQSSPTDIFLANFDRSFKVWISTLTSGVSPGSLALAYTDWFVHLSLSPGKQVGLWFDAINKTQNFKWPSLDFGGWSGEPCITPLSKDRRFKDCAWDRFPYNLYQQLFLSVEQWWQDAVTDVDGVSQHHTEVIAFINRQILDALSPTNFIVTNPVVQHRIQETLGQCLATGWMHYLDDCLQLLKGEIPKHMHPYTVGKDLAVTPGKVVYRNRLIELIQYSPCTEQVYAEPLLIVPAWIMKYYILDLAPGQSLVEYLVAQGHTVFLISWKNPTAEDANIGFNDYMKLGILESLDVISSILPKRKIHVAGYCIGGILLTIAATWLSRLKDKRLRSVTLLAAQSDFTQGGELMLFMDESQLAFLNNIMSQQGFLNKFQLKGIFQLMHSADLVWSYMVTHYLMGERPEVTELMAWSADATRLPYRMHKEYLEKLYLHDELAEGHYQVEGKEVALNNLRLPIFCVATEKDHLSPWRSVYKLHLYTNTEITFVLTNGGHNAGIVSQLDNPRRHYRIGKTAKETSYQSPDDWLDQHPDVKAGSWWTPWHQWLVEHSSATKVSPPNLGNDDFPPLADAPGTFVHQQ